MKHTGTKFERWLRENRYTDPQFAAAMAKQLQISQFSPRTVEKWRLGLATPRKPSMLAIMKITDGAITADSFIEEPQWPK